METGLGYCALACCGGTWYIEHNVTSATALMYMGSTCERLKHRRPAHVTADMHVGLRPACRLMVVPLISLRALPLYARLLQVYRGVQQLTSAVHAEYAATSTV